MEDRDIVTLYWQRDEEAIRQTDRQYGRYLSAIAFHILADREDSRETVNDTYLRAWGSMPPHRPQVLATYLGRITRQLSIDRWRTRGRAKRGGSQYALSLEELGDCVSGAATPEEALDLAELGRAIGDYLRCRFPPAGRFSAAITMPTPWRRQPGSAASAYRRSRVSCTAPARGCGPIWKRRALTYEPGTAQRRHE